MLSFTVYIEFHISVNFRLNIIHYCHKYFWFILIIKDVIKIYWPFLVKIHKYWDVWLLVIPFRRWVSILLCVGGRIFILNLDTMYFARRMREYYNRHIKMYNVWCLIRRNYRICPLYIFQEIFNIYILKVKLDKDAIEISLIIMSWCHFVILWRRLLDFKTRKI